MFQLQGSFLVFFFLLIPAAYSKVPNQAASSTDKTPLVLQWEVSHPRNTDQISLIFRGKRASKAFQKRC